MLACRFRDSLTAVPRALILMLIVSICPAVAEAATFTAVAEPPASGGSCGGESGASVNSPVPVMVDHVCSDVLGTTRSQAFATFGGVGATANSATFTTVTVPRSDTARATFTDTVVFSKTDPSLPGEFSVSLNLSLSGVLNAAAPNGNAGAGVEIDVSFLGVYALDFNFNPVDGLTIVRSDFGGTGTIAPGGAGFESPLTTVTAIASVGDVPFSLTLFTGAFSVGPGSSARADFFGTLEFPTGIDVFNLPDGYTANAGNYLVNNRFVDPNAVGVPEPTTVLLLAAGLAGLMVQRRLRRT